MSQLLKESFKLLKEWEQLAADLKPQTQEALFTFNALRRDSSLLLKRLEDGKIDSL